MSSYGARTNRSVVDLVSQKAYPSDKITKAVYKKLQTHTKKVCSHSDCSVKLSFYNETNYCAIHERTNANTKDCI